MADFIYKRENEPLDIDKIMDDIRKDIRERKHLGLLTDKEIKRIEELELESVFLNLLHNTDKILATDVEIKGIEEIPEYLLKPRMGLDELQDLYSAKQGWNIDENYDIATHRPGIKGRIILLLKRLARPFVKLYTDKIFYRQKLINYYFMNMLLSSFALSLEVKKKNDAFENTVARLDAIERDITFLRDRQRILEDYLEELEDKLNTQQQ